MTFTNRQKIAMLDAKDASLRLLAARRTAGRYRLYLAISLLVEWAIPVPAYPERKALRERTLKVGRDAS